MISFPRTRVRFQVAIRIDEGPKEDTKLAVARDVAKRQLRAEWRRSLWADTVEDVGQILFVLAVIFNMHGLASALDGRMVHVSHFDRSFMRLPLFEIPVIAVWRAF